MKEGRKEGRKDGRKEGGGREEGRRNLELPKTENYDVDRVLLMF